MQQSLEQLIKRFWCVAIIGMEKNTGKTTVLNHVLGSEPEKICAVTSIGYDGEEIDQVTGTKKPVIYVGCGTLVATASSLLGQCDFTREMLSFTGIHTALGEVIILRALSDGYVRLAGPSITALMEKLLEMLKKYGAEKVYIDGAAARKSTAAISAADACILATGSAFSPSIDHIVEQTAYNAVLLQLPVTTNKMILSLFATNSEDSGADQEGEICEELKVNQCFSQMENGQLVDLGSGLDEETPIAAAKLSSVSALIFKGAFSSRFAEKFLAGTRLLKGLSLVATDGTRFLLTLEQYNEFVRRGATFAVVKPGNLAAITVNPFAPSGFEIDADLLKKRLQEKTGLPVFNVVAEPKVRAEFL